ncbi:MAG: ribonuclease III [Lachnospiraceae bacterium]|nr:ribonuclease III [Lachnospiraceae bacterium]
MKDRLLPLSSIKPLALAYLGDTVLDLYVRTRLVAATSLHPKQMHMKASSLVNAASQAAMMKYLKDSLTPEEQEVFRHGRNAHSGTIPRNQSPVDYKWATGFEALLGYLYLTEQEDRLYELMRRGLDYLEHKDTEAEDSKEGESTMIDEGEQGANAKEKDNE